jgi:hypothetical protein
MLFAPDFKGMSMNMGIGWDGISTGMDIGLSNVAI